jgi:hypothetical protein
MLTTGLGSVTKSCAGNPPEPRPVIRTAYDFGQEKVHFGTAATDWADADFRCHMCEMMLPEALFVQAGPNVSVPGLGRVPLATPRHPYCDGCRERRRKTMMKHPLYSRELDKHFNSLVIRTSYGAYKRKILCCVDKEDVLDLFLEQNGVCKITGLAMDWKTEGQAGRNARNYKAPSIDRINSSGNYVIGNIQIVMAVANIMKNDLPMDMFVALCQRIADHNALGI